MGYELESGSVTKQKELRIRDFGVYTPPFAAPVTTVVFANYTIVNGEVLKEEIVATVTLSAAEVAAVLPNSKLPSFANTAAGISEALYAAGIAKTPVLQELLGLNEESGEES